MPVSLQVADTMRQNAEPITDTTFRVLFHNPNGINPRPSNSFAVYKQFMSMACLPLALQKQIWTGITGATTKMFGLHCLKHGTGQPVNSLALWNCLLLIISRGHCDDYLQLMENSDIWEGTDSFGLGCWSFVTLRGKRDIRLTIITTYQVCASPNAGITTAYMQQYLEMVRSNQFRDPRMINPRWQCVLELQSFITSKQQSVHDVILLINANEALNGLNSGLHSTLHQSLSTKTFQYSTSCTHDGKMLTLVKAYSLVDWQSD